MKCVAVVLIATALIVAPAAVLGQQPEQVAVSPKEPWEDFEIVEEEVGLPWWKDVLLWFPNRIMDLVDVFRVDVGAGTSAGAVLRLSKYGQVGYRQISSKSVRIGDFGRHMPYLIERTSEGGVGPFYENSKERRVCTGEVGLGIDFFVAGAYAGICVEELADFVAGLFFIDLRGDDID